MNVIRIVQGSAGKRKYNLSRYTSILILVLMIALMSILNKQFLQALTFKNLMQQVSAVGIVSIGAMFVIISGGIDLSAGYALALCGVTAGVLYTACGNSLIALVLGGVLTGSIVGAVNGIIITKLKIQPFITTLAMMSVCQGLTLLVWEGQILLIDNPAVLFIGQGLFASFIPFPFIIFIAVCLIGAFLLYKRRMGVYTYALGGNENSVILAGVNTGHYKRLIYIFAGTCTGIASVIVISIVANVTNNLQGSVLLDAIASTVIGGTSVSGGKGTVLGTFVGVIIIGLIFTVMTFLNVDVLLRDAVKGFIIILALMIDIMINQRLKLSKIE